jgi:hypothetical protein
MGALSIYTREISVMVSTIILYIITITFSILASNQCESISNEKEEENKSIIPISVVTGFFVVVCLVLLIVFISIEPVKKDEFGYINNKLFSSFLVLLVLSLIGTIVTGCIGVSISNNCIKYNEDFMYVSSTLGIFTGIDISFLLGMLISFVSNIP